MIIKKKIFKDLPIEIGKRYLTRFQTGESFYVTQIVTKKFYLKTGEISHEKVIGFEGIYLEHKHLGVCPIAIDRVIPESIEDGFMYVCECCGEEVTLEQIKELE